MRKDRSLLPVRLTVSHLTGVGEDSVFMGILEVGGVRPEIQEGVCLSDSILTLLYALSTPARFVHTNAGCPGPQGHSFHLAPPQRPHRRH